MTIAERIDIARKLAGIKNQAELARIADINESTLARILKGSVTPSLEILAKIALACKVTIDWIVNGTDTKQTDILEVSLAYVTQEELKLLTQFREANTMGKQLIKSAGQTAPKQSSLHPTDKT